MNPHKHADIIKAWADGAEIQWRESDSIWRDIKFPEWRKSAEYRVKPEPAVVSLNYRAYPSVSGDDFFIVREDNSNLRLTFTDGVLTSAEVIHD